MPWTVTDVPRFTKKAKTDAQKKKWVAIANGVLESCRSSGGSDCEGKAIRIANSKFDLVGINSTWTFKQKPKQSEGSMPSENKIPKGALRFVDSGCHAHVEFAEDGRKLSPKLNMVGYSGGIIKDHWYWGDLAIDLEGIKFSQSKYPVLENHDTNRKIAVIGKPVLKDGKLMAPENATFLSTKESEEFQKLSSEGFPYQSSIYAKPTSVERLEEGTSTDVNGYKIKGPASVWRACEFKEMSVCVFGWDSKTQASAFSKEEFEDVSFDLSEKNKLEQNVVNNNREEVFKKMDREELMEKYGDIITVIVTEAVTEAETSFAKEKKALSDQLEDEKKANTTLSDRVKSLEKTDLIRREKEFAATAKSIWSDALSNSKIPVHLHDKISQYVNYSMYVKEGEFDEGAFSEAVKTEVKDWEDRGIVTSVIGSGFSQKEADGSTEDGKDSFVMENKSIAERIVARSGLMKKA